MSKYFDIKKIVQIENDLSDNNYDIFIIYNIFREKNKRKKYYENIRR